MPRKSKKQTGRSEWMKTYNKNIRMQKDKMKDEEVKKPTEEKDEKTSEETTEKVNITNFKIRKSNRKPYPYRSPAVTIDKVQLPKLEEILNIGDNKTQEEKN